MVKTRKEVIWTKEMVNECKSLKRSGYTLPTIASFLKTKYKYPFTKNMVTGILYRTKEAANG